MSESFSKDVAPIFTDGDVRCMGGMGVKLAEFDFMADPAGDSTYPDHANAHHVLARLKVSEAPRMPPGGAPWSDEKIASFESWMAGWNP